MPRRVVVVTRLKHTVIIRNNNYNITTVKPSRPPLYGVRKRNFFFDFLHTALAGEYDFFSFFFYPSSALRVYENDFSTGNRVANVKRYTDFLVPHFESSRGGRPIMLFIVYGFLNIGVNNPNTMVNQRGFWAFFLFF